ncbi:glycoside hydrolase family 28 protein [Bradyrhizobium sp.]|uniref:glycoside hydrolase family 28 protein n=1 Tax=Bradyrhizobium sp. TaxID=376 RepID=UPI002D01436F|nr:glycosyl hydrolase family 28 protein [Bradyrhizobium sp.]HWX63618.1 glycosyl hydrolase family 28 protein [Bradyrhizobium sp.]
MSRQTRLRATMLACVALMAASGASWADGLGDRDRDDHNRHCDPRSYGAVNDGKTDNTNAIQSAIDRCALSGGGIVPIAGGGVYVTGPIELRSRVFLQISAPTVLKNTADHTRYQPAFIGYPFRFANDPAVTGTGPSLPGKPEAMISANDVVDAGIVGDGTIDGSGADPAAAATSDNPGALSWWQLAANAKKLTSYPGFPDIPTSNGLPRPWLVEFYKSKHIRIEGVLLTNSPMWDLGLRYDDDVTVEALRVFNNANDATGAPNTDGVDLVGSTDVKLAHLDIDTGDDDVAMKSGLPGIDPANPGVPTFAYYKPPYNLPKLPLSGVHIAHSTFKRGHGMSVGSETVNGVDHIRAHDITFLGTDNGFRIKTGRDRGNEIADMKIERLTMTDVATPISISAYYPTIPTATQGDLPQPQIAATQPCVHDIAISDVVATNPQTVRSGVVSSGGLIIGLPEAPIRKITLDRISIASANASGTFMRLRNVDQITCKQVTVTPLNQNLPSLGHTFDNEGGLSNLTGCDVPPPTM